MTVEQCYREFDGDYEGTLARLNNLKLIEKLLKKFSADVSIPAFEKAISLGDGKEAFRITHTLKGVALNLGFTQLAKSSSALTEQLRGGEITGSEELMQQMLADYEKVKAALVKLEQ